MKALTLGLLGLVLAASPALAQAGGEKGPDGPLSPSATPR